MCNKNTKKLCNNSICIECNSRSILNLEICQQLIDEFDIENNMDIELLNLPYSSHTKIHWRCKNNHKFYVSLNSRTNGKTSCKICKYNERSKDLEFKKLVKEKISKNIISNIHDNNKNGLKNEEFVYNLIKSNNNIKEIHLIGYLGGFADIIVKLNNNEDKYYLLQVKTITKTNETTYYLTNDKSYQKNLLVAMVDNSHRYFALEFAGNINVKRLSLAYNYKKSKYSNIMMTEEVEFSKKIMELISQSQTINNVTEILTEPQKKEFYMRERLREKCRTLNLLYVDNKVNSDTIDCYINNIPIQLKYSSLNQTHRNTIQVTMRKSCGRIQGKNIKQSYHINDKFEIVIIQLENYNDRFCIIPKKEFAIKKCISTNDITGSGMCYLMPPDTKINHWTNIYWDNWNILYTN